jgi:hypothetical protein
MIRQALAILSIVALSVVVMPSQEVVIVAKHAAAAGGGTVNFVQGAAGTSNSSSGPCIGQTSSDIRCTPGSNITSGNMLVIVGRQQLSGTGATMTVTTNSGPTCTGGWQYAVNPTVQNTSGGGSTQYISAMAYCQISSTGATQLEITWGGGNQIAYSDVSVAEYHSTTGFASSSTVDQVTSSCGGGNCTVKSTAVTTGTTAATTNAYDLVVCGIESWDTAPSWPTISGYTRETTASSDELAIYDKSATTTGTQVCAFTGASDAWLGVIAAFKTN